MPTKSQGAAPAELRPNIREVLALNLVSLRNELGWSQDELALEAGLHRTFIAHVERRSRNISLDNLERIAAAMGVLTHRLLVPPGHSTDTA